jgi:transglutaminase-like putative cysteine protease
MPAPYAPESSIRGAQIYELSVPRALVTGREISMVVESLASGQGYAPVPGPVARFEYASRISLDRRLFITLSDAFPIGRQFYVRAQVQEPSAAQMRAATQSKDRPPATAFDRDVVTSRVREIATELARGKATDYDFVMDAMRYVGRAAKYNLKAEAMPGNKDKVETFLFETKEGYCDLFATSLAVILRSQRVPARVAVGYRYEGERDDDGWVVVQDRQAHMWTEVYFEEFGWVPFDPTDLAESVPGAGLGSILDDEIGDPTLRWAATTAAIVFGTVLLVLVTTAFLSWNRNRRAIRGPHWRLRPHYAKFLAAIARELKRPRQPAETTRELVAEYRAATGNGEMAQETAEAFEHALYGVEEPSEEQIREIQRRVDAFVLATRQRRVK